jgi:DNA-binding MarR family transcriptional regulator
MAMPLPTLLSQVLVAYTIEFDNEFEHQMPHRTTRGPAASGRRGPWLVSQAMWSNFMRFVDPDGTPLTHLAEAVRLTNLAGLRRWGYVTVDRSAHGADVVRPTRAGLRAQQVWTPLEAAIERRWCERFGAAAVGRLRQALGTLSAGVDRALPAYLPVSSVYRLDQAMFPTAAVADRPDWLSAWLSQVLLAYTLDYERESRFALAVGANVLRILTGPGVPLRELPRLAAVSREAASVSVTFLDRNGYLTLSPDPLRRGKQAQLTPKGLAAQRRHEHVTAETEDAWVARFGKPAVAELRASLEALTAEPGTLAEGLEPYADGWRAHPPYRDQTARMRKDPVTGLPWYPMVSHRGGFPDGS